MYNQFGFDESIHGFEEVLGNNFTEQQGFMHQAGMRAKNDETQGKYQAKVSGDYGEFSLKSVINSLPDCFHLLNDYLIQTKKGSTQLDHIMVCPWGIFVIETKNFKGWIFGDMQGKVWTQVLHNQSGQHNNTFYSPFLQNQGHLMHLYKDKALQKVQQYIIGLICFTNPEANLLNVNCPCCMTLEGLYQYFLGLTSQQRVFSDKMIINIIKHFDDTNTNGYLNAEKHIAFVEQMQNKRRK